MSKREKKKSIRQNGEVSISVVALIIGIADIIIFMLIAFFVISHADRFPNAIRWFVKEDYIKHKNF